MIVARHVGGKVVQWRAIVRNLLIALFLVGPWIPWGNRPAILLDIDARKFYFPGVVIWPQEFYFLMFFLLTLGLSLFLFTALFGRIWCGWACPQTVYTELFDAIGRLLFPSKYGKRSEKAWHKVIVHSVWILVTAVMVFHFLAYFSGAKTMLHDITTLGTGVFTANTWPFFFVPMTVLFYLDMGFFREQVCVYICPYARFQSVMLDRDSIVISYDSHRGEPRRKQKGDSQPVSVETAKMNVAGEGDCTACNMCVQVCPTGIDIREGLQVACINCAHCIDACTHEMGRFDKKSLVNFASLNFSENRIKPKFFRPRTVVYSILFTAVVGALTTLFAIRVPIHLWVIPDPSILPVTVSENRVQNFYKMDIGNMTEQNRSYKLAVKLLDSSSPIQNLQLIDAGDFNVAANQLTKNRIFLIGDVDPSKKGFKRHFLVEFRLTDLTDPSMVVVKKANFNIPEK